MWLRERDRERERGERNREKEGERNREKEGERDKKDVREREYKSRAMPGCLASMSLLVPMVNIYYWGY